MMQSYFTRTKGILPGDFHPRAHNCWNYSREPQDNLPVNELSSESCELFVIYERGISFQSLSSKVLFHHLEIKAKVNKSDTIGNGFSESNFEL